MSKNKTKKNNKELTIKEFKAWLDGILEFQKDDWTPDPYQWKAIKNKIANLKDEFVHTQELNSPITVESINGYNDYNVMYSQDYRHTPQYTGAAQVPASINYQPIGGTLSSAHDDNVQNLTQHVEQDIVMPVQPLSREQLNSLPPEVASFLPPGVSNINTDVKFTKPIKTFSNLDPNKSQFA